MFARGIENLLVLVLTVVLIGVGYNAFSKPAAATAAHFGQLTKVLGK